MFVTFASHKTEQVHPFYMYCFLSVTVECLSPATSEIWTWDEELVSFPFSSLDLTKNRNGGGGPGIDSHVISQHDDITAISRDTII